MAWKLGSLQKGLVLDMPLMTKYHNPNTDVFTDRTPWSNHGANNGGDVDTDHTTFIAANSDYVRIPDSESLSPTVAMTAMIWVKGAAQVGKGILCHSDVGVSQYGYTISSSGPDPYNKMQVVVSDDGTIDVGHSKIYYSSIIALDNTWHLVGFTFDAGTLKFFIDGVEDTNPTKIYDDAITTIINSTADIMIGCYLNSDTPTSFFDGDVARPRMWNRALTSAEWKLAFDQTKGLFL